MSDNWVVQNLENALETWNEKLSEIWTLITTTPQNFKGGNIWKVIVDINGAVQAIGLALLVLFFVIGMVKTCGSFTDVKKPEHALKLFVRFALAKGVITYGMELMLALFNIVQGTISKQTNVDTNNRLICYDILDLGKQLMPIGMLVVLDSILNRITQNRAKGKNTFIFIDEIYLLFQHEYSANFLFTLWKRVRKYGAYASGITQNVDDLLQSHTARTMLANSEFIIMLNQASTDRLELAKLLNISDLQMSYITNVEAGHGLIKVGSSLVPFANKFPKNTKLYKLMTTKPGEA
ncbi:TraG/VirB4 family ATPase [Coprococcus comes]|uniref:TraG/VirB4 family ATPase n=1 Tax=Coprococcus comes TaxID=410072 RepID=UPI002ED5C43F